MWPFRKKTQGRDPRDNRWTGDTVDLVFPVLEPSDVGANGARFVEGEFQAGAGAELFLGILEDGQWARQYGRVKQLDLFATTLAIQTDAGPVAMVLWQLGHGGQTLVQYEHYLDPLHEPTRRLLRRIESQSRLKVVMRDNRTGETAGFWEFENIFAMGEFAEVMSKLVTGMDAGPFKQRVALVQRDYSLEDLIAAAEGA